MDATVNQGFTPDFQWGSGFSLNNGSDTVPVPADMCNGIPLDVIGQIGVDPGSEWSGGGVGTANETIRRLCAVTTGDPDGTNAFDPSVEWASFGQDVFSDLGGYSCP